jgi:hypothetical protein
MMNGKRAIWVGQLEWSSFQSLMDLSILEFFDNSLDKHNAVHHIAEHNAMRYFV